MSLFEFSEMLIYKVDTYKKVGTFKKKIRGYNNKYQILKKQNNLKYKYIHKIKEIIK